MVSEFEISPTINNIEVVKEEVVVQNNITIEPIITILNVVKEETIIEYTITVNPIYEGLPGPRGLNNYELARANGFEGTYEEWEITQHGNNGKDLTLEDFNVVPETTTLVNADEFLVKKDGVWKKISKENLQSQLSSNEPIVTYTHTANQEIYFSSFDYSTGIGTTTVPHGYSGIATNVLICPNGLNDKENYKYTDVVKSIPYEYLRTASLKINFINSTQIKITNSTDGVIAVNQTSTENLGNLDFSKWHIETLSAFEVPFPPDVYKFAIELYGYTKGDMGRYWWLRYYDEDLNIINPTTGSFGSINTTYFQIFNPTVQNQNHQPCYIKTIIDVEVSDFSTFYECKDLMSYRNSGANSWGGTKNLNNYAPENCPHLKNSRGVAHLRPYTNAGGNISNHTTIKIYKR